MAVREIGDPRLQTLFGPPGPDDPGIRPVVRLPSKGLPPVAFAVVAAIAAVLLFLVLNGRRTAAPGPSDFAQTNGGGGTAWAPPPPLYIPPAVQPVVVTTPSADQQTRAPAAIASIPTTTARTVPQPIYQMSPAPLATTLPPVPVAPRVAAGPALVIDTGQSTGGGAAPANVGVAPIAGGASSVSRMRAGALANRSMTVPQGHMISAVLETGFDSTKPGFARAIVSRDVRGFDGANVLIPRGSRLIGEYHADISRGQKRAVIAWTRLIRPDGMTIALDSPAVDPLGRGGIPASVNTHFFERFGEALLQSTIGIGQAFAGRATTGPIVVLPGAAANATTQLTPSSDYTPTLTVPPGTSINVFVAHDLDFSGQAGR